MEGLLLSEMTETVKGMLQNFLDLVKTYAGSSRWGWGEQTCGWICLGSSRGHRPFHQAAFWQLWAHPQWRARVLPAAESAPAPGPHDGPIRGSYQRHHLPAVGTPTLCCPAGLPLPETSQGWGQPVLGLRLCRLHCRENMETLALELDFWTVNRTILVNSGGRSYTLNHYRVPFGGPR